MTPFTVHDPSSGPHGARPFLQAALDAYGFVPNLLAVLAEAPAALEGYLRLGSLLAENSSLNPVEEQVVSLSVSYHNRARYCMAAHSTIAATLDPPAGTVEAVRTGQPLPDPKLNALATFTQAMARQSGRVDPSVTNRFLAAGYTNQQLLEVILVVGTKTIAAYVDHFARLVLDDPFQAQIWTPPEHTPNQA